MGKTAAKRLETTQAALEVANGQIAELESKRSVALLKDDYRSAEKLLAEIEQQRRFVRGYTDQLALLRAEAEREENDRRVKERATEIERIEVLAAERDEVGKELAAAVKILDEAFRKLIALAREITDALPLGTYDPAACLLSPGSITRALQHELHRCSRPRLLGGMDGPEAGVSLPGALSPSIELINAPDRVTPLVEVLAAASRHLSQSMRTGKAAVPTSGTQVQQRVLTAAETKLADLHRRQAELAERPDADAEYDAIVKEIAKITAEIEAARGVQHNV
jgi:hypothetical protein